jgi:hypothetical protein
MEAVVVAVVTGVFAVLVVLVEKGRKENKRDHGNVMDRLDLVSSEIRKDIRQVRYELNDHANGPAHNTKPVVPAKIPLKKRPKAG